MGHMNSMIETSHQMLRFSKIIDIVILNFKLFLYFLFTSLCAFCLSGCAVVVVVAVVAVCCFVLPLYDDEDHNTRQYSSYGNRGHTTTKQQGSSSDDDIKIVFEDICKDVDCTAESKEEQEKEECYRCVTASWSTRTCSTENEKKQACWESMNAGFFFTPNFLFESNNDIVTAARMFEARSPDQLSGLTVYIAQYLQS